MKLLIFNVRTYRKLFDTIERGVEQCTTDRLQTLLEEKKEQLKLGLEAFGEPSSQARNKINNDSTVTVDGKQIKLQKNEKDLVLNLSDILQLNELTCASLWNTYKQINSDLVTRLTETKDGQEPPLAENTQLIMNVINFYYEDRLSLLECIGSLLRISMDDSHLYTSIATNTIQKLRQDDSTNPFIERLFSQFSKLTRSSVPSRTHSFSNWAVVWAKQNLKEQKAILEIIFLLTLTEPISPKLILSFIQEFEADCFGYLQAFGYVLDEEGIALRESVTALCMILSANIIVPPTLKLGAKLDAALRNTSLIDTPDVIAKINQVVAYLGTRQEHSVFLLAWSFFLTCVDTAIHSDGPVDPAYTEVNHVLEGKQNISASVLINRPSVNGTEFDNDRVISIKQSPQLDRIYLGRSLKLNVFDSIAYILESNVCSEEDVNNYGYRAVFKTLLNSFLSTTRPHYIPVNTYASLVNSYCLTYNNQQSLSRSFWAEDFDKENPFSLLATARGRFPVFFSDLIQLLAALSGGPNDETDNGDTVSAAYVYEYLAHLSTITVILPSSVNITAFEENGEVIIQADQAIQVTAKNDTVRSITIPEGTCGSLLNKDENDRVVQFQVNYSGWHLLTAVLGSFLTEYNVNAIDIKDEEKNIHGKNPEAIYNVLALIHNVLSSSPKLVVKLVEHIEQASASTDSSSPTLVSALFKILNYCSTIKPYPVSILTLTLKCLTLLIPEYRDCIWRHLKHAHMLPTANTTYHLSTGYNAYSSNPSSQIQEIVSKFECTIGRYTFLLSFLDFVQALVYDVQRKWWDKNALDYHSQVEVLYICLYYLMSDVFPSYSKWRYKKVSERFLIGTKVLSILITIASDFKEHETVQGKLTLKTIREGIFNNFLYDGGIYHISPLVDTISEGAKTANALYNSSHPKEAHRIEKLTELTFIFVKILLQHRLEQINEGGALSESTLERLLLERSSASNSSDFLLRVARHINYRHNIALPIQATNVLTLLCRTTSFWKSAPNFVQFLGSTDQIHGIVRTYLGIAKDHSQNESLLAAIWQFITTLMETQPSLAILFLDCGDFIMPSPKSAVRLLSGETKPAASAPVTPTHESAIRASVDILSHWETLSIEKPTATSNALRFLATFWKTAFDHYALVERARVDNALWDVLGKVLLNLTSDMDISNDQIHNANMLESMNNTHYDNQVRQRCCLNLSKAFVMRIIVYEIHLTAGRSGSSDISEKIPVGLKNLMNKINEPSKLTSMRDTFVKNDFNPTVVHSAEFSAEQCVQMLAAGDASMLLFKMSRLGSGDDGEAGENRQYGDAYLYDYHLAATKIKSLYAEMKVKYEHAMMDDVIVTPEVKAVLELRDNANKFLQNLLLANHNTSIVDSQVILLRAYKTFIEATSRRASDLIWANKTGTSGTDSLYQFLKGLIQHAQQENRADGVALTSYSILMQFIRHLIEDWISKNSAIVVGVNAAEKKAYSDKAFELLSSLCGLLNRENYALFNSICDRTAIRFHRPLLESILLCLRTLNGNVGSTNDLTTLLNVVCSSFNVLVIKATSYSAVGSDVSEEVAENCIKDVTVVTSLLQEMISPKYKLLPEVWLDIFEKSNTIPAVLSLFYRGLEVLVKEVQG